MPTYDFKCIVCGSIREVFMSLGEDSLPVCCEKSMERVWTTPPAFKPSPGMYSYDN